MTQTTPYRRVENGIELRIRLTPKSAQNRVGQPINLPVGAVLTAQIQAIPQKGAANTALIELIAKWLRIPKSDISLQSGGRSRIKTLAIHGNSEELAALIDQAIDR